jgi:uncharacterized repeat protein (TIGR03803 family)
MTSKTRLLKRCRFLVVGSALILVILFATGIAASAQTFKTLVNFNGYNGASPQYVSLVRGRDGNFYGTTLYGGAGCEPVGCGTVFKITAAGALTTLYTFCAQTGCTDGAYPNAGLVMATDGNFYGTTLGSNSNTGTVFKISSGGTLNTLYTFCAQPNCIDGQNPEGTLIQGSDGNFYGTTYSGGIPGPYGPNGTVFKISPSGVLTTLHLFNWTDGAWPSAGLAQGTDRNYYGTTVQGGAYGEGTVFKMTPAGALTTLHSFESFDGIIPYAGLVQASDGSFYGSTGFAGVNGGGTVFNISPWGKLTTLYSFCAQPNCADGSAPQAALVQGTDGNLYGATSRGGDITCNAPNGCGTVFRFTLSGALRTLHTFESSDGAFPDGGLLQDTSGVFYGTTYVGGTENDGTVFSLGVGLRPFVSFVRGWSKVGQTIQILGQKFTGTTGVSFNGTPASFTVESDTFLIATVPAGATTGPVAVTTPSVTLGSNVPFRVAPQFLSFSPPSGPVGTSVTITGESLTQTSAVSFGGVRVTTFTVDSDTQITATVPTGAQSGEIVVLTQGGTAFSPGSFTVTQ